jgi:membrane protein YqaA with SNARE-associated domain
MRRLSAFGSPAAWLRAIVHARCGPAVLFWTSFLEAVILPLPLEAVLAPYMQMRRDILWRLATVGVAGFLTAALAGYAIGALLYDGVGAPIVAAMGWRDEFAEAQRLLVEHGFWAIILVTVTPIPTQIAMIGAGALGYPLLSFVLAMALARGVRYYGLAVLVLLYGDRFVAWVARRTRDPAASRAQAPTPPAP